VRASAGRSTAKYIAMSGFTNSSVPRVRTHLAIIADHYLHASLAVVDDTAPAAAYQAFQWVSWSAGRRFACRKSVPFV